jgi:hypothetical protein
LNHAGAIPSALAPHSARKKLGDVNCDTLFESEQFKVLVAGMLA